MGERRSTIKAPKWKNTVIENFLKLFNLDSFFLQVFFFIQSNKIFLHSTQKIEQKRKFTHQYGNELVCSSLCINEQWQKK